MIAIIASSSAFGLQIYTATPRPIFWGVLAAIMAAILAMIARRLPQGAVTLPLALAVAAAAIALVSAVASGVLTPAEVMHVPLFGGLGATLYAKCDQKHAFLWLAAVSVGDEVLQAILPYRTGSIQDVALNFVSGLAGYFLAARLFQAATR
jgi:hypothetical protein